MSNRVFTTGEAAEVCGVSADTVSRWFDLGHIEGYRLGPGGDRRIPYEGLRKFMLNHGIPLERLEAGERQILLIDEDPYYLDFIPEVLSSTQENVCYVASTGFDAGALLVEHNPQLVILDLQLSDMNPRMICKRIKGRVETQNAQILGLTSYAESEVGDEEAEDMLPDFGMDSVLKKPFSAEALLEKINSLTRNASSGKRRLRKQLR